MSSLSIVQAVTFSGLITAEAIVSYVYSLDIYDRRDTQTSVVLGIISAVVVLSTTGFYVGVLEFIRQLALFDISPSFGSWVTLFMICDLSYYLLHLLSHRVRFLWASHMLHHSASKLNYTTVMRGPVVYLSFRMIFWIPMVLIGFPTTMILVTDTCIQLYTILTHTTVIGRLGFFEWVLNTPAHHRLHHACNTEYIDRNFGGVLIVWDRLFGTYAKETKPPVFGLKETRDVHHPIQLLLMEWKRIVHDGRQSKNWKQLMLAIFGQPK